MSIDGRARIWARKAIIASVQTARIAALRITRPSHLPVSHEIRDTGFVSVIHAWRSRISNATVAQAKNTVSSAQTRYIASSERDRKVCT